MAANPEFQKQLEQRLKLAPPIQTTGPPSPCPPSPDDKRKSFLPGGLFKSSEDDKKSKSATVSGKRSTRKKADLKTFFRSEEGGGSPQIQFTRVEGGEEGGMLDGGGQFGEGDISEVEQNKNSPALLDAVKAGNEGEVASLLEGGAWINSRDPTTGSTPLHIALQGGPHTSNYPDYSMGTLLFGHKEAPDLTIKDEKGKTPLHILFSSSYDLNACEALLSSLGEGSLSSRSLCDGEGNTLIMACLMGETRADDATTYYMLEFLIDKGVPLDLPNNKKESSFHAAVRTGIESVVDLLITHSADETIKNNEGMNALELAVFLGFTAIEEKVKQIGEKNRLKQVENIYKEILSTEETYCRYLQTIIDVYRTPMTNDFHMSPKCMNCMFFNVSDLLQGNSVFCEELKNLERFPVGERDVGSAFLRHIGALRAHVDYCENIVLSDELVKKVRKNQFLNNWCNKQQRLPECEKQDLESFLIKPLQRVCKYPLLIRELMRSTPETDYLYSSLDEASKQVSEIVGQANEKKRVKDTEMQAMSYFEKDYKYTTSTKLIREMPVKLVEKDKLLPYAMYLFTDVLVFAVQKKDSVEAKHVVALDSAPIIWNDQQGAKNKHENSFVLARRDKASRMTIVFESEQQKTEGMTLLGERLSRAMVGMLFSAQDGPLSRLPMEAEFWQEGFSDPSSPLFEATLQEPVDEMAKLWYDLILFERESYKSFHRAQQEMKGVSSKFCLVFGPEAEKILVAMQSWKMSLEGVYSDGKGQGPLSLSLESFVAAFPDFIISAGGYSDFVGCVPYLEHLLHTNKDEKLCRVFGGEESLQILLQRPRLTLENFLKTAKYVHALLGVSAAPAYQGIMKKMVSFVEPLLVDTEQKVASCKEFLKILSIQDSLEGAEKIPLAVREDGRVLLGKLEGISELDRGKEKPRILYLFNDMILVANVKIGCHKLGYYLRGDDLRVEIHSDSSHCGIDVYNNKVKKEKGLKGTLCFKGVEERDQCLEKMKGVPNSARTKIPKKRHSTAFPAGDVTVDLISSRAPLTKSLTPATSHLTPTFATKKHHTGSFDDFSRLPSSSSSSSSPSPPPSSSSSLSVLVSSPGSAIAAPPPLPPKRSPLAASSPTSSPLSSPSRSSSPPYPPKASLTLDSPLVRNSSPAPPPPPSRHKPTESPLIEDPTVGGARGGRARGGTTGGLARGGGDGQRVNSCYGRPLPVPGGKPGSRKSEMVSRPLPVPPSSPLAPSSPPPASVSRPPRTPPKD